MNAFFASVEQLDNPEWQGRALVITMGSKVHALLLVPMRRDPMALKQVCGSEKRNDYAHV
jgi:hypothetical protein